MTDGIKLENEIEILLHDLGLSYARNPVVGNTRPDFLVTTESGARIVMEAKAWPPTAANITRAMHQVRRYKELAKAAAALVVTPDGKSRRTSSGMVVPLGELKVALLRLSRELIGKGMSTEGFARQKASTKQVFASMPFAARYDDTFLVAIQPA